jgi:hypothetical protein
MSYLSLCVMKLILITLACIMAPFSALAADFQIAGGYAQSRDFWQTVHDLQDKSGNLSAISKVLHDRYGQPDILYSYLDASYAYPHGWFESDTFSQAWIGTRAEALAGGEVSNPIFPEVQAYADTIGIASYGLRSGPDSLAQKRAFWSIRVLGGGGPEKRLNAEGPDFLSAIPVRSGKLYLAGAEVAVLDQAEFGGDFFITTDAFIRPVYFHSSVDPSPNLPDEQKSFVVWRWRLQNEWLKEIETPFSNRTRIGIITVAGQTPVPFTSLPISWDYQQKTQFFPGVGASSGIGGMIRLLSDRALPNVALYLGEFGGGFGGGLDLQIGPAILNVSSYALENALTTSHDRTRLWQATAGVAL